MTSVMPYLCVECTADTLDYYVKAFDAEELYRLEMADGNIPHAEIKIGDSLVMIADERPDEGVYSPKKQGVSVQFTIDLPDVETLNAMWARATDLGATIDRDVADRFYGRRSGTLRDPFGHRWQLSTLIEEVSPEEMKERMPQDHFARQQEAKAK